MKKISIISACYNEEENIIPLYEEVKNIMSKYSDKYVYEHIFGDNKSIDNSQIILEKIANSDKRVKVVFNLTNYGVDKSCANLFFLATGNAVISMASDFQDPIELIPKLIEKWEEGNKVVWLQRNGNRNKKFDFFRNMYYKVIEMISECKQIERVTGSGLYDAEVVKQLKDLEDPVPLFRNSVLELGYDPYLIPFEQRDRRFGKSSYNFVSYLNTALISFTMNSRVPLRIATYLGTVTALGSLLIAFIYLILKLLYWDNFNAGIAPVSIGIFFLGAVQLICLGIVGEYVGNILSRSKKVPLVIVKKKINF